MPVAPTRNPATSERSFAGDSEEGKTRERAQADSDGHGHQADRNQGPAGVRAEEQGGASEAGAAVEGAEGGLGRAAPWGLARQAWGFLNFLWKAANSLHCRCWWMLVTQHVVLCCVWSLNGSYGRYALSPQPLLPCSNRLISFYPFIDV